MPITFSIEASERTMYTTVTGPLLDADPVRYLSDVLRHPAYCPGLSALVVCKNVEAGGLSTSALRRCVAFTREMEQAFGDARVAVVADQPVVYGLARMYQLLRSPPYELQVFRERSGAEAWLAGSTLETRGG
jgi:hypothetical protein